jgi:5-methylcytosine-specific restriction endonuclease McrA
MAAKHQGRKGRPWRRVVAAVKASSKVCHLCGHEIDHTLPKEHPYSYTTDHVQPRSRDGAPSVANGRPAHRSCNSRKGNRTGQAVPFRRTRVW